MPKPAFAPIQPSAHGVAGQKDRELEKMAFDDLGDLRQRIIEILDRKSRRLQDQLDQLGRKFGGSPAVSRNVVPIRR
jgi:hypothetical protein